MNNQAFINYESQGTPSVVDYNVPETIGYDGLNIVELDVEPARFNPPPIPPLTASEVNALTEAQLADAMAAGFADARVFPDLGVSPGFLIYATRVTLPDGRQIDYNGCYLSAFGPVDSEQWLTPELRRLAPADVLRLLKLGGNLSIIRLSDHRYTYRFIDVDPRSPVRYRQRIALVESYRLSSFLGSYGAGGVVNTFSLLPGERAKVTVRTYKRTTETSRLASTILDSLNDSSSSDFETAVQDERSDRSTQARMDSWHVEAELTGNWGTGSAHLEAGYKGSSSSARQQFAQNVSNALDKHVQQNSSRRDVKVEQTTETTTELTDENVTEREIRNINVGRSLNFVFRQLNQEYYSLLHLIDVRVGYTDGVTTRVVPLYALDDLLRDVIKTDVDGGGAPLPDAQQYRTKLRGAILDDLGLVFDHQGNPHDLVETVERRSRSGERLGSYVRFRKGQRSTYQNPITQAAFTVDGVIVAVAQNVLRTDGVITEALLGRASGLDPYSRRLQEETVRELRVRNDRLEQQVARERAVQSAIRHTNAAALALVQQLYPAPPSPTATMTATPAAMAMAAPPPIPALPPAPRPAAGALTSGRPDAP